MDLFHRERVPADRTLTWIKPFDNRMEEILRLKEKSETCPKEMKKVFLSAWGELASSVKAHQQIASAIVDSGLPLSVYYNVVLTTDMGSGACDFLILSDEWILSLKVRKKEHIEWDMYDTRFAKLPDAVDVQAAEDAACLLGDWLTDNRAISRKDMQRLLPVLIDDEEPDDEKISFPQQRSLLYPEMCAAIRLHPNRLAAFLSENCQSTDVPYFPYKKTEKIIEVISEVLS